MMSKKQSEDSVQEILRIIEQVGGLRKLARLINEDLSDIWRWKSNTAKIRAEACIKICRLFDASPQKLRPDIFTSDVKLTFKKEKQ